MECWLDGHRIDGVSAEHTLLWWIVCVHVLALLTFTYCEESNVNNLSGLLLILPEAVVAGVELPEAARPVRAVEGSCSAVTVSADLPCLLAAAREPVFDCSRWSSLTKSVRVVGWVRRFYGNARSAPQGRRCGDLSVAEIESARHVLLREEQRQAFSAEYSLLQQGKAVPKSSSVHQLTPFLGEDGLLRIRGRLQQSELPFEERHPILIPKGRVAELLVRDQHRLMSHCGVTTLITAVSTCVTLYIKGVVGATPDLQSATPRCSSATPSQNHC